MKLSELTSKNLVMLDAVFQDRLDAIQQLTQKLDEEGKLSDRQAFLDAVMTREEEGPTALGEGLAVPHGKSSGVKEATFACAFVKGDLQWQGLDGDEPVEMVFLLAIPPAEAGSTHMGILTELTSSLVDDDFRASLLQAKSPAEVLRLFGDKEKVEEEAATVVDSPVIQEALEPKESNRAYGITLLLGCAIVLALFALM